jgi:hypothetical protein
MSRGLGCWQWLVFHTVKDSPKPVTFQTIIETLLAREGYNGTFAMWREDNPSRVRAMRRALDTLVCRVYLIELGSGGRRQPFRYCVSPHLIEPNEETQGALHSETYRLLCQQLIATGQAEALAKQAISESKI